MGWLSEWANYFAKNIRRLSSRLREALQAVSMLVFLFSAIFGALYVYYSHGQPFSSEAWSALGALSAMLGLLALGGVVLVFAIAFAVFFVLSLHGKGRKLADRFFKFTTPTKLEALEARVGKIEAELPKINGRLESIENRLGSIEAILEKMAKGTNQETNRPSQKPKQRKTRRVSK